MMPAKTLRWIVRGCLMATLLAALLPWDHYVSSWGNVYVSGWDYPDSSDLPPVDLEGAGYAVGSLLVLTVVTIGLSWMPVVRAWGFVGSTASLLLLMYWMFEFNRDVDFGPYLAFTLLLAASIFGLFAFIQHKKRRPAW